jgi:hypothetical protein
VTLTPLLESGGFGDHVVPFHSPEGTPGEWMEDPYGEFGQVFVGPGELGNLPVSLVNRAILMLVSR